MSDYRVFEFKQSLQLIPVINSITDPFKITFDLFDHYLLNDKHCLT